MSDPLAADPDEKAYRWAIRAAYGVAIGLNLYIAWLSVKDSPEWGETRARAVQRLERVVSPFRRQQRWKATVNRLHWEAREVVENAN